MLSKQTLRFLDDVTAESHVAYPEGGVVWTYESANQAYSKFVNTVEKADKQRFLKLFGDVK